MISLRAARPSSTFFATLSNSFKSSISDDGTNDLLSNAGRNDDDDDDDDDDSAGDAAAAAAAAAADDDNVNGS